MEPAAEPEIPSAASAFERIEATRELLLRIDPEFFQETVRHLEVVAAILRARRAVEASAARNCRGKNIKVG